MDHKMDHKMEPDIKCGMYKKYSKLHTIIERLEPAVITMMYKEIKNGNVFFPNLGIFFNEFALVYSSSINVNKK